MNRNHNNRIGFVIHAPREFDFYRCLWKVLQSSSFEIILDDHIDVDGYLSLPQHRELLNYVTENSLKCRLLSDVLKNKEEFQVLVSTKDFNKGSRLQRMNLKKCLRAFISATRVPRNLASIIGKRFSGGYRLGSLNLKNPERLGIHRVMFPRGIDLSDKEPEESSISFYNHFFCHGRFDAEIYSRETSHPVTIIGYPRYDDFRPLCHSARSALVAEFELDPAKPFVIWMAGQYDRSVRVWADALQHLQSDFNVICRPHPKQTAGNPGIADLLNEKEYKIDQVTSRSLVELYSAADFVLADWGDSIFGSLYCGVKTVMLNFEAYDASRDRHGIKKLIREKIPNYSPDKEAGSGGRKIRDRLLDVQRWPELEEQVRILRDELFGEMKQSSVERASLALQSLAEEILRK